MKKSKFLKSSKDMLSRSFNPSKCKTSLRLAASRLKLLRNKKEAQVKQMRREISVLLESGQDQTARIRVEHVIREEKMMAAFDLIEIYCELIIARLPIIESQKTCPIDLKEAITSIVFASPRCGDVPELVDARKQFSEKYGKEFITTAIELRPECGVSRMLVEKLSAVAPDVQTKTKILSAIAKEYNVEWDGESIEENSTPASDFLSGPSTFVKVSEQPSPSNQLDRRTSLGTEGEGLVSTRVSGVNTAFQHETRPQASGGGERAQIFRGDSNTIPYDRPRWNMEFKDATSAAQAAAESAEMASMAARAAAELSRRDSLTRQSDDHSPRDGAPHTYMRSKMVGENRSFSEHSRLQNEKIDRVNLSNTGGRYEGDRDVRKEYSHSSSLQSKASVDDDSTDRYYRKNSLNEVSRSEESMQRQPENVREETIEDSASRYSRSSSRGSAVVFDKSDSESENDEFHGSPTYDEPQQVLLSSQKPRNHLSTNTDSWSPSPKSSTSKTVKPPASVLLTKKSSYSDMYGSRLDDSVSVAFDESDGRASESEEDTRVSSDFFSERKQSVGLQSKDKSGPSFGSPYKGSPQYDQTQLSPSSDYESEEMANSERYQRKKFVADPPAKLNIWKPAADQPALVLKKNRTELNNIGDSSPEREEGLNFGKLTGGLRHKGYNYPSFGKNQLDVSLSKKESKETTDTFTKSTVVPDLQPTLDNDSSEEEEEEKPLQKRSDHKHKLYTLSGGKDLKTKPSFVASNSLFGSENSDLDEDLPKELPSRPRRLHSGISRRTKAFPSDHEKEKFSKLQHRSEALDVDDGMYRKATTSTSSETPKRYETKRDSNKLGSEPAKPETSTSVRIQKSKVSEAHEQKPTKSESQQQFQSLKGNSSDQPSSSKVTSNSRGSLYHHSSEKANSPRMQESKVSPKSSSAKVASLPQTKSEPFIRQENPKAETLSKTDSNKDSSYQKASHVHPKLPEYDSLVQFFQNNRS